MNVFKLLNDLGSTTEEVAKSLFDKNIKGKQRSHYECPIAHFLKNGAYITKYHGSLNGIHFQYFELPNIISDFIRKFDTGCYPNLIEK